MKLLLLYVQKKASTTIDSTNIIISNVNHIMYD